MPVYEEVLVVEKRLMLKEEIHFVRKSVERHERQSISLRKEEVRVLRSNAPVENTTAQPAGGGTTVANASSSSLPERSP
jgi:stress response protein YsnF